METRKALSDEDVAAAADRLVARNEKPTIRAVRTELRGGSLATIQPALAKWRAGRRRIETTSLSLPAEIQRVILVEIDRSVAAARAELEVELSETQSERDTLVEELERQSAALAAAEVRGQEQAIEAERQGSTIGHLERSLTEARELLSREREAAESARKAGALAELRLESLPQLHADVVELRAKLDAEREARRAAEIEAAELRGKFGRKSD